MTASDKPEVDYRRRIPALRPGGDGPKAKFLDVRRLDEKEQRASASRRGLRHAAGNGRVAAAGSLDTWIGCFADLGWHVPDDFDAPLEEVAAAFEGQ
jgi:hypothetical protein